ncbi:MAG: GNAT family N-acetyltransferase [Caulobacterales bacterium]|nr:GNAT family N-acetyltransferase [Caulobacterales bacterium]
MGRPRGHVGGDGAGVTIQVRLAPRTHAALFPAIERSAGEAFRAIPDLAWIADHVVSPAEEYLPMIAAGTVWEAVEGETPVGVLLGEITGDTLHVWELSVLVSHQKQGLGRRLMQAAADHARTLGLAALTLTTFRTVPWNGPFYAGLGYQMLEAPLPDNLQALIDNENARGLNDRCAMRLAL